MKPIKNHYHCPRCQRSKMLFNSKKEALLFLKYNAERIEEETGKRPMRTYYCNYCCGWHLTSKPHPYSLNDLIKRYGEEKGMELYGIIYPIINKGRTIAGGISRKIQELRHNLKYPVIKSDRCQEIVDELFDVFEAVIEAQLEERVTVNNLLSRFSDLCKLFQDKKQMRLVA